jgi:hypothetical protein
MAANTSTTYVKNQIPRVLADRVLAAATPTPILLQLANQYSIAGRPTNTLRLNRRADVGPATAATEGTAFTTETSFSFGTEIELTVSEAAAMLGQITNRAVEETGLGYENALELFQSNNIEDIVAVCSAEAEIILKAINEKREADLAALLASMGNTVGDLTADLTLDILEQAIFTSDTLEQPHDNRAFVFSPRGISFIRKILMTTSGGVQGVLHQGKTEFMDGVGAGYVARILDTPVYKMSQSMVQTSGTVPGTGGHLGCLMLVGSGNPEVAGGSGQVGALQYCEKSAVEFSSDFVLRGRAVDLLGIARYAVALRAADFAVAIRHNDVVTT